jgi:hypothetical protein
MYDLFVSYQSDDIVWVRALVSALEGKGLRVFFAPTELRSGSLTASNLDGAIRSSKAAIIVISQRTASSRWVELEVNLLITLWTERKLSVLCPLVRDPTSAIPWMLAGLVGLYLRPTTTVEEAATALLDRLRLPSRASLLQSEPQNKPAESSETRYATSSGVEKRDRGSWAPRSIAPHRQVDVRVETVTIPFYALRDEVPAAVALAPTPLTQGQLLALYPHQAAPDHFNASLPVTDVTVREALAICADLSERAGLRIRLPSPSEWERAYRAGTRTLYFCGGLAACLEKYACYGANAPSPVASYRPNPWQFYDMAGNVWEACREQYWDGFCVARGGSYQSSPEMCSAHYWIPWDIDTSSRQTGIRLALELDSGDESHA